MGAETGFQVEVVLRWAAGAVGLVVVVGVVVQTMVEEIQEEVGVEGEVWVEITGVEGTEVGVGIMGVEVTGVVDVVGVEVVVSVPSR